MHNYIIISNLIYICVIYCQVQFIFVYTEKRTDTPLFGSYLTYSYRHIERCSPICDSADNLEIRGFSIRNYDQSVMCLQQSFLLS